MTTDDIETKIDYDGEVYLCIQSKFDSEWCGPGHLFVRTDYHEDGSRSTYYGIELTEAHYNAIKLLLEEPKP